MYAFPSDIFIGDILGFVLALPFSLFMAFWVSVVKKRLAVVLGALIAFGVIFLWASSLPGANGGATFFGSVLICSIAALVGGILTDLLIARIASHDYRRIVHE
jgi:uncharacterized membrane protein YccC